MKVSLFISFFVGALLIFFIMKSCDKPTIMNNSELIKEKEDSIAVLQWAMNRLEKERDSLITLNQTIDTVIIHNEERINEQIAGDSTKARVEFNKALIENNILPDPIPDNPNFVSFRDLGNSAKLMAKVPKMELQIKGYDEIILKDNEIISNLNFQIDANEDLREMQRLAIINCENKLDKANSFWNSKELWFGLGIVGATAVAIIIGSVK